MGGPARNIGKFSGANVIGLNISDYQLKRARTLTAAAGLQDTVTFQKVRIIHVAIYYGWSVETFTFSVTAKPYD